MNKMAVEVLNKRGDAFKVKSTDGRITFISRYQLCADKTVDIQVFENSYKRYRQYLRFLRRDRKFDNTYHPIVSIKETDKAVAFMVSLFVANEDDNSKSRMVWIPKLMVKDGRVRGSVLRSKFMSVLARATKNDGRLWVISFENEFFICPNKDEVSDYL